MTGYVQSKELYVRNYKLTIIRFVEDFYKIILYKK